MVASATQVADAARVNSAREIAFQKTFVRDGKMRFGIFWPFSRSDFPSRLLEQRNPDILDVDSHIRLVQAVEEVGLDMVLVPDIYASAADPGAQGEYLDPSTHALVMAQSLIWATRRIGVVSTIHTTFYHPVQIARFGGHLSHLSGGRWGWNIVVGRNTTDARLFGFKDLLDHDQRYDLADECIDLVRKLWTSPHGVDHEGKQFSVHGRLRGPLPASRPMLVSASASDRGHRFAIDNCDYLFASAAGVEQAVKLKAEVVERSRQIGREPPPIMVIGAVLVRERPGAAQEAVSEIIDAFAAETDVAVNKDRIKKTRGMMTDYPSLIGTPDEVAEKLIALHATGVTGVMLRFPYWTPEEVQRLEPVLRRLEEAGVWSPPAKRAFSW
jgi:dimethylsulfone monooxygenase